jgi:uncharacterized cupredoxin-like copper-binding protein
VLAAVSTQNKLLLGGMALIFIVFALVVALVIPRTRPEFPGRRLNAFLGVTVLLFVAMLLAVEFFAVEEEEAHAETSAAASEGGSETMPAVTSPGEPEQTIRVSAKEFELDPAETQLSPGTYDFELVNDGTVPHDLVVSGPEVEKAATPVIGPDKKATIRVALVDGEYELYCSVPGHEDAGMSTTITVGG